MCTVSVDKPFVDIFTRIEAEPEEEKPPKKARLSESSEYAKYKKAELIKMLEERDEEARSQFKQDPSAIDRVTALVTPDEEFMGGEKQVNWHDDAAIYELVSDERLEMMSVLRRAQIRAFARAWWICDQYDFELGKEFLRSLLKFAISGEGLGRNQFLKALMSGHPIEEVAEAGGGFEGLEKLREMFSRP